MPAPLALAHLIPSLNTIIQTIKAANSVRHASLDYIQQLQWFKDQKYALEQEKRKIDLLLDSNQRSKLQSKLQSVSKYIDRGLHELNRCRHLMPPRTTIKFACNSVTWVFLRKAEVERRRQRIKTMMQQLQSGLDRAESRQNANIQTANAVAHGAHLASISAQIQQINDRVTTSDAKLQQLNDTVTANAVAHDTQLAGIRAKLQDAENVNAARLGGIEAGTREMARELRNVTDAVKVGARSDRFSTTVAIGIEPPKRCKRERTAPRSHPV